MYELFVKSHFTFALALFITLWLHVRMRKSWEFVCLLTASAFWTIHYIIWLARILYRNGGLALSQKAELAKIGLAPSAPAVEVTIQLDRPWKTLPGQYLYLTFPEVARGDAGFIQTHPFVIAWAEGPEITLLIQRRKGVSNTIYEQALTRSSVIVDGPYGSHTSLYTYDKVLFMCSGIGIAAHLLAVRHLLEAHENQSARVRRLTLVWFLETAGMYPRYKDPRNLANFI
jgi:predicted ferric reductase